ncbi:hypothetical protein D030_3934A, partial [Vibrio parahaemolyticus AQ3810]
MNRFTRHHQNRTNDTNVS